MSEFLLNSFRAKVSVRNVLLLLPHWPQFLNRFFIDYLKTGDQTHLSAPINLSLGLSEGISLCSLCKDEKLMTTRRSKCQYWINNGTMSKTFAPEGVWEPVLWENNIQVWEGWPKTFIRLWGGLRCSCSQQCVMGLPTYLLVQARNRKRGV